MNCAIPPAYAQRHWAKTDQSTPPRIHLLEHHLADVSACFEALLKQPTIRKRLARTGGKDDLDEASAARLCVLAALHDVGKANTGFQTEIWRAEDLPPQRKRPPRTGHDQDFAPVLTGANGETAQWLPPALGWNEMLGWDDRGGETVCAPATPAASFCLAARSGGKTTPTTQRASAAGPPKASSGIWPRRSPSARWSRR